MIYPEYLIQRFWRNVAKCLHAEDCQECCWEWIAGKTLQGYGSFRIPKQSNALGL